MKNCILVIDSGVGGVSVLNQIRQKYPQYNYIYYADSKFAPYGNKTQQQISTRLIDIISKHIKNHHIVLVVVACNTATAMALTYLDSKFGLPILGIQPDIENALKSTKNQVLALATVGTVKHSKVLKNLNSTRIIISPQRNLAKMIDDNLSNLTAIKVDLQKILAPYKYKQIEGVILGCTHYFFIKELITEVLGDVKFFDSIDNVIKKIDKYLTQQPAEVGVVVVKNSLNDTNINALIKKYIKSL